MDSRATLMKVGELDMDFCAHSDCGGKITEESDKQWVVANVYTDCCTLLECRRCRGSGRRWLALERWHQVCYANAGSPYGEPVSQKSKRSKSAR